MSRYAKSLAAFLTGLGGWGATAGADGHYTQPEMWGLTLVVGGALAVYAVPNRPPRGKRRKPDVSETAPAE